MKSFWNLLHKIGDILHLPEMPHWLVGILALTMVLRIPSLFEPYYYGDEMIYMSLGTGVRQGETLYKDVYDNKPPLLYLTAALAGNLFWFKSILAFWNLATIFIFWKLAEKLLSKNTLGIKVGTFLFALLTTLPLLEGNIVNAELFMIGPTILAFLILLSNKLNTKSIFFAGVLFSIASLFKIPAAFEIPVIIVYWCMVYGVREWKKILQQTTILSVGFALPILLTFVWYFLQGAFNDYLYAAYLQNLGYVHSWAVRDVPMLYRAGVVSLGLVFLWVSRNKISKTLLFVCIWTLFALFGVVLSGRPYPHYFIQAVAALSILLAIFLTDKTREQSLTVIPLTLIFFVPFYYKFWFYPTISYYQKFLNFATTKIDKQEYFNGFNERTNRNYELAKFIQLSSLKDDRVFMWDTDSATVYSLARRLPPVKYVADYHVRDYSSADEITKELTINKPKFIILTNDYSLPEINPLVRKSYFLIQKIGDASIFSRIDL